MSTMMLLPCPFCGGEPEIVRAQDEDGRFAAVGCPHCGAGSRQHYFVGDDAVPHVVSAWNRRAHLAQPAQAVDRRSTHHVHRGPESIPCYCAATVDHQIGNEVNVEAVAMALRFHEAYERLAPSFGYETRTDTRAFDPESPNGRLMTAVCAEVTRAISGEKAGPVDGWKLVPVEPTQEMIDRGTDEHECEQGDSYYRAPSLSDTDAIAIYKAMLSASPAPDKE